MASFETPGPVALEIHNACGVVEVTGEARSTTEVTVEALHPEAEERAQAARVELKPGDAGGFRVLIEVPRTRGWDGMHAEVAVRVRAPEGVALRAATASGDVHTEGLVGPVGIDTASGDIWIQDAGGDAVITTASGDINIRRVTGSLRAHTASGACHVDEVGGPLELESASGDQRVKLVQGAARLQGASADIMVGEARDGLDARTASGDITVHQAAGVVRLRAQSGDVEVRRIAEGRLSASSASGDVSIGVARGSRVRVDLDSRSGRVLSQIPIHEAPDGDHEGGLVELDVRTASGDIRVGGVA